MNRRSHPEPPRQALAFLSWYCNPELLSEIEGDLREQFLHSSERFGNRRAVIMFWLNTILFLRPFALRRDFMNRTDIFHLRMWPNYAKTSLRHMRRHKGYSSLSVIGLTVGFACAFVILLFVQDEISYDRFHVKLDRLYRVDTELTLPDGSTGTYSAVSWPVGRKLRENYAGVEEVVHMRHHPSEVRHDGTQSYEKIYYAENGFFSLFSFPFVSGDPSTALENPNSIVISREMEQKYFNGRSALGSHMVLQDSAAYTVTGVLDNLPRQSHLEFDILVSYSTWLARNPDALEDTHWLDLNMFNYVLLDTSTRANQLAEPVANLLDDNIGEYLDGVGYKAELHLQPVKDIYLKSAAGNPFGRTSDINYVHLLGAIGVFILLIASVNFINLGTARSVERASEVGMRKVVGSSRALLIQQFMIEAILTCFAAVALGFIIAASTIPYFNELAVKDLVWMDMTNLQFIASALLIGLGVGVLAGLYPAVILSGFNPSAVLKGAFARSKRGIYLRRSLVVFQFAISCILIVATLVVFKQLQFMKNADVGFDREQVLVVDATKAGSNLLKEKSEVIKTQLTAHSSVSDVSATFTVPGRSGWRSIMVFPEGRPQDEGLLTEFIAVDHDYISVIGLDVIAGRDFNSAIITDSQSALIVNEAAVHEMGWGTPENAIGKQIQAPNTNAQGEVIGVVRNYNQHGLQEEVKSVVLGIKPYYRYLAVRTEGGAVTDMLDHIDAVWSDVFPGLSYEHFFLDTDFDNQYRQEVRLSTVFTTFALLAIFISCLGLFGLAAFSTLQRSKEIGIRKVNGASNAQIVRILSKEFILLVLGALLLAVPVSYQLLSTWLESFANRVTIGLEVFLLTSVLALAIAFLTVAYQALRAALANPIETLRYE